MRKSADVGYMTDAQLLAYCNDTLQKNVVSCRTALEQAIKNRRLGSASEQSGREILSLLGKEAERLHVPSDTIADAFRLVAPTYIDEKIAARTHLSPQQRNATHTLTRSIASVYASCHAYAQAIVSALSADPKPRLAIAQPLEEPDETEA